MPWHRRRIKKPSVSRYLFYGGLAIVAGILLLALFLWVFAHFTATNLEVE